MTSIKFFTAPENSKSQEQYCEYVFLKDMIEAAALQGEKLSVSRTDFDSFGFDLLLEFKGIY